MILRLELLVQFSGEVKEIPCISCFLDWVSVVMQECAQAAFTDPLRCYPCFYLPQFLLMFMILELLPETCPFVFFLSNSKQNQELVSINSNA